MSTTLLLVGGGKMGGALLDGWLDQGVNSSDIFVIEPDDEARERLRTKGVRAGTELAEMPSDFSASVTVFAVKPQAMDEVVPAYAVLKNRTNFFLSIAAGKPTAYFEAALGDDAAIVRTMPNTPAAVGRGITVLFANPRVDDDAKAIAEQLLSAVGATAWVNDEGLMDAVTAVSGSGPAYIFYLIECLASAGVRAGLPPGLSQHLARATVCGAGELAYRDSTPVDVLRRNVTSPGGTTEAALAVLMKGDALAELMGRAVVAATERSRELAT
jgi:pyrroline-5-carboxylate reductase